MRMPSRLSQRGISQPAWNALSEVQQRELVRESDKAARPVHVKQRDAGEHPIKERARRFAKVPEQERGDYWRKYHKPDNEYLFWDLGQGPF